MAKPSRDLTVVVSVPAGETLDGRWLLETRIGHGAMGSVFRGRDLKTDQTVAIKLLSPEHCRKTKVLARFEREAAKMIGLRHPNIVHFYGQGRRGAIPYIVMEHLEGMTLHDVIKHEGGALPLSDAISVVKQLAAGLACLHHHGLVHRDVKPQNVFVSVGGRITILDLGVVHDRQDPGLTKPGAMIGTPYYMSPEQIMGSSDIDRRTDIYSLASMTFELLTGSPPFLGANNFEVLYGHRNVAPPDASVRASGVSKAVAKVIIRGMAKQRGDRPETTTEFVADLEAAAGASSVDLAERFAFVSGAISAAAHDATKIGALGANDVPMAASSEIVALTRDITDERRVFRSTDSRTAIMHVATERHQVVDDVAASTPSSTFVSGPEQTGQLRIIATAKSVMATAQIELEHTRLGTTPFCATLPIGAYRLRLELADGRSTSRTVEIKTGSMLTVRVKFDRDETSSF